MTFNYLEKHSNNVLRPSSDEMFKEIIIQALPFILVGSGITLFKLVDQYTFERLMRGISEYSDKQLSELFSIFSVNPDKLVMLVIAIATAMATASLPLITEAFSQKNTKGLSRLISDNIQLFFFIMMPATIGMMVLAFPLNTLFYSPDSLGSSVLIEASLSGLFMGYFMLVSTTLQGIYEDKSAMLYLGYGLLVKIICQIPAVRLFEVYGPLLASIIGFTVTSYLTTRKIYQKTHFNWSLTARRTLLISILTMLMWLVTFIVRWIACLILNPSSKVQALVIILIVAIAGGAFYAYMSLKLRLADKLLGHKVGKLRSKLHIK